MISKNQTTKTTNQSPTTNRVFSATDFVDMLQELQTIPFNITKCRNKPILEPTKRNQTRRELLDGLKTYLEQVLMGTGVGVYRVEDGVALEIPNPALYELTRIEYAKTTNGTIGINLGITMRDLEYEAYDEALAWEEEKAE